MACLCEMIGLACFVAVVLSFSNKAPYRLKMTIFTIGAAVVVLICMPFMIFRPKNYKNGLGPAWGCRQLCKAMGVTMEVRGLENIRQGRGSVVLINHQSAFDLCVLAYLWPIIGRATVVCKQEVFYYPFFGIGAWLWGTLFIKRSRKTDSINALQKEATAIKERGCKLLIFPEGTRNSKETLLPFKKGPFHIALQTQCPIQPVVISKYWFLNSEKKTFHSGHAIIQILPEIPTTGYTACDIETLIAKSRGIMQAEYIKLSQKSKPKPKPFQKT